MQALKKVGNCVLEISGDTLTPDFSVEITFLAYFHDEGCRIKGCLICKIWKKDGHLFVANSFISLILGLELFWRHWKKLMKWKKGCLSTLLNVQVMTVAA